MVDNNFPASLKTFMYSESVNFQLVPPHHHRTNAAKSTIETYKDHLVAGLISCDPALPLHLWDRLLSQETFTLNLLHPYRINPRLSAEAQLKGVFYFNHNPLAPSGTKFLVF